MSDLVMLLMSILKTFAESSTQKTTGYWKRFGGLVTGSAHKYRYDPFFRSEVNIVVLQFGFAVFLLFFIGTIANQFYRDASLAVTNSMKMSLSPNSTSSVIEYLGSMRTRTIVLGAAAVILVTTVFTYVIARIALSPTRNALASQKQFIGNVAHELRTPLAVSKTNLEVALMSPIITDPLKRSLESTVEELDRISEIINNLLSLSASIRRERIEFADVDLGTVVSHVMRKLQELADSKRLEVEIRMSDRRIVWGNTTALEQVVMNIIKNAISYTSSQGRILVAVEPVHPDLMEFTVQDSGKGIARKDLFRIFEPFYRADPSRSRDGSSSGLGLTIVSELVKLHNGRVSVRSAEGRGTTVTVMFPAGKRDIAMAGATKPPDDTVSEIAIDFSHGRDTG